MCIGVKFRCLSNFPSCQELLLIRGLRCKKGGSIQLCLHLKEDRFGSQCCGKNLNKNMVQTNLLTAVWFGWNGKTRFVVAKLNRSIPTEFRIKIAFCVQSECGVAFSKRLWPKSTRIHNIPSYTWWPKIWRFQLQLKTRPSFSLASLAINQTFISLTINRINTCLTVLYCYNIDS